MALLMQKNCSFLGCVLSYTEKKEPRRRRKDSHNKDLIPYCSDAIILAIYVIKVKHPGFLFWEFSLNGACYHVRKCLERIYLTFFWLFFFLNTSNIFFLGLFLYNKSLLYSQNLSVWKIQCSCVCSLIQCSWKILKGDLVLKKRNAALPDPREKFRLTNEGPYVVKKVFQEKF